MSEWLADSIAVVLVIGSWLYMNHWYRRIHGAPLRIRYLWAAHGAILFRKRFPRWERKP